MLEFLYKVFCNKYVLTILTLFTLSKTVIEFINGNDDYAGLFWGSMTFINLVNICLTYNTHQRNVPDVDLKNIDLNEVTTSGHYNFDNDMTVHSIKMPELKRGDLMTIETEKGIETVKVVNEYKNGNDHIIETTSLNGKEDK